MLRVMTTFLVLTLLATVSVAGERVASNPFQQQDALYVGHQGIARFEVGAVQPSWHVLVDVATLEPVVAQGIVLVGSSSGLYAVSASDGRLRWSILTQSTLFSPTVVDGIAYVGAADGMLRAVRVESGEIVWQRRLSGWVYAPAVSVGVVVTGGSAERLWGLDQRSGKVLWERPLSGEMVFRPQSTVDGGVAVSTFAGEVLVADIRNGQLRWRQQMPAAAISLAVLNDQLFVGGFDGQLRTYQVSTGSSQWQHDIGGRIPHRQQFTDKVTVVGNDQGVIDLVNTATGELLYRLRMASEGVGRPLYLDGRIVRLKFDRFSKEYKAESVLVGSYLHF